MTGVELLSRLRSSPGMDVVALGGALLAHCREHAGELRTALADPAREQEFLTARHAARNLFEKIDEEDLDGTDLARIADALADAARADGDATEPSYVLAVRAFAEGLDDALGARFAGRFRGRTVVLAPGDPCPTHRVRIKDLIDRPSVNPDVATEPIDRLPRLALAPPTLGGLAVKLSWHAEDHLVRLKRGARLAAAIPNRGLDELEYDRYSQGGRSWFYRVRPRDRARQERAVLGLLELARRHHIEIVVLPELSVDAPLLGKIREWHRAADRRPSVLVAGSHHVDCPAGTAGQNECVALLATGAEVRHRKFRPYVFDDLLGDDGAPAAGPVERTEHLAPLNGEIAIQMTGDWSFVTLVCKDLLELPVVRLLEDLRVRLILVPACTPKTDIFLQRAAALATNAQAVVVIANLGTPSALFGRPSRDDLTISARPETAAPVLIVLDTSGKLTFHEVLDE